MKSRRMEKHIKKGSFTIETACIMSLVLITVTGLLYLCFFVHNRAWLTSAACEAALAGSMEGIREDGKAEQAAETRARALGSIGFWGIEELRLQVAQGKRIKVVYTGDTKTAFGNLLWKLNAEGSSKVINPVIWIRNIKATGDIITGGE